MQEVSVQMAVGFAVTDHRLYGGSSSQFLFDLAVDATLLAGLEDPERLGRRVAPVALVDINPLDLAAGQRLGLLDHLLQGVAAISPASALRGLSCIVCRALIPKWVAVLRG